MNQVILKSKNINDIVNWALNPFPNGLTYSVTKTSELTVDQIRKKAQLNEKEWGNKAINQNNNGNWTTLLGEGLVYDILTLLGENPRRPEKMNGYSPDWETDNCIYEVKTRNWCTSGTAGEKVFGTMYKYSDIPLLYQKPLKIICIAYQEYELSNGTTKIFGIDDELSNRKKTFLQLARSYDIEYVKFSDLFAKLPKDTLENVLTNNTSDNEEYIKEIVSDIVDNVIKT